MRVEQLFKYIPLNEIVHFVDDNSGTIFDQDEIDNWDSDTPLNRYKVTGISSFPPYIDEDGENGLYITVSEF